METLRKMMSVSLLLGLCTSTAGSPLSYHNQENRTTDPSSLGIKGGSDATIAEVPYQAAILKQNSHFCGASIVAEKFILTAAHCFRSDATVANYKARVGTNSKVTGGQNIGVTKISIHPQFTVGDVPNNDVAVVELATRLVYGTGIQAVVLPTSAPFKDGDSAIVTGWGKTDTNKPESNILQKVTVSLITTATCMSKKYAYEDMITDVMFCAGAKTKDVCKGDSGGPIMYNGLQIGIVSWSDGMCQSDPETPSVYTKITAVLPFINRIIH